MSTVASIRAALTRFAFAWANEDDLQRGIALALDDAGIAYQREHDLGRAGRVDFFVDGIALEVKVRGGRAEVVRQLHRYAEHESVAEVLLVTPSLRLDVPLELTGKPVSVCRLEPRL